MNLYFLDSDELITFSLPNKVVGNFWMTDNEEKNIVNISAKEGKWVLSGSNNYHITENGTSVGSIILEKNKFYSLENESGKKILYATDEVDNTFKCLKFKSAETITIGNQNNDITYNIPFLSENSISFAFDGNAARLKRDSNTLVYLNNRSITNEMFNIKNGDVVNIYGLKIIYAFGTIFINNAMGLVNINNSKFDQMNLTVNHDITKEELEDIDMYSENDYYLRSPRIRRNISTFDLNVDSPPQKEANQEVPIIYTLAPMLTMGASSIITLTTTINQVNSGEKQLKEVWPTLVVTFAMIFSMLIWPFVTKEYEKRRRIKRENDRQVKYKAYLDKKKKELADEYNNQRQILEENLIPIPACYEIITEKRRTLWERKIDQSDFLTVRVGSGQVPIDARINYHVEDFKMEDDNLKKMLEDMINEYSTLSNVPIGYSFSKNNITAINGLYPKYLNFVNSIILQMMAFHSYDELKFVVFTNKKNASRYDYLKETPYCFSSDKGIRFFATNSEEMQEVSLYLEQLLNGRKTLAGSNGEVNYASFKTYFVFIIDDILMARKIDIVNDILEEKRNLGFSLIILEDKLSKLPSQCNNFISIGDKSSGIFKNNATDNEQIKFIDEIGYNIDMMKCSNMVANLPIFIDNNSVNELPSLITFLELFSVGNVEQLNSLNRWKNNNIIKSLKTEVGVNENGDPFILDIHEKQHGPHGLIAGMTGSGKSEFIITYILSMAVNYSPEEVAFVLIDYKGGGLAGTFDNPELGIKLPHVVGTITNLDKAEINRALSSIDSELRRRQEKFNETRDLTGENTIDIYKYQKMYRDGIVSEPMPHLVIVCDEFAELKSQQPEFMEDLISTARIGRSLGVHLILATQKPSGVVDSQIWSNSKFKICLKVQEKSDSMEMINRPDAAELKNVGRFYLQVGYNEFFAIGQAAYAGSPYYPRHEFKKNADKNIYFINNVGSFSKAIDNYIAKKDVKSDGEELGNVLKYIIDTSNSITLNLRRLWLERIPEFISIPNLIKKYNYTKQNYIINPVIGEYDDPSNQRQGLLTLPLTDEGNVLLYGSADSGRDEFVSSLVYSLITTYTSEEVDLYLLDYGAEVLMNYIEAPQVGDVILNGDDEKLNNFVKMMNTELNKRKKSFASYNGNYKDYIKLSHNTLANIVVVINVIEVMTETYADLFDKLFAVIREGSKYGINFVITTTNQNSIRFKVAQTCRQIFCLQLNNDSEYRDILGKTDGLVPFKCLGRGLARIERVCEFQTASIAQPDELLATIKATVEKLKTAGMSKTRSVPIMPDSIPISMFATKYTDITNFPIGLAKETLSPILYDYSKNVINIISANEMDTMHSFMLNYLKVAEAKKTYNKIVVDANNFFEDYNYNIQLVNSNFDGFVDSLKKLNDQIQDVYVKNNMNTRSLRSMLNTMVIVLGIDKLLSKLDDDHKQIFKDIVSSNRETLKINFVFIDIPSNFKKYEYDDWYKNNIDTNNGLWIGQGFGQQFVVKSIISPSNTTKIEKDYAIVVRNGLPTIIKLINEIK